MTRCAAPGKAHFAGSGHMCDLHLDRLRGWLRDVLTETATVDVHPATAVSYGDGHASAPAFERAPVRLDALVATDPRAGLGLAETPGDRQVAASAPQPHAVLRRWATVVRSARQLTPPHPALAADYATLDAHLAWCATRPWIGDLYRAIQAVRGSLQRVNGTTDPKPVGRCTQPVTDTGDQCGGPLWPQHVTHATADFVPTGPELGDRPVSSVVCGDNAAHQWKGRELALLARIVADQRKETRP